MKGENARRKISFSLIKTSRMSIINFDPLYEFNAPKFVDLRNEINQTDIEE